MRDIGLITSLAVLALLALKKPQVGILAWLWISIMNPHRIDVYGLTASMPLLDGLVAVTMLSCMIHWKDRAPAEFHPILKLLLMFYLWCSLTTLFAVDFSLSTPDWIQYTKTMLLVLVMLLFMNKKHWIIAAVCVFVLSIGYTSIKGGIFTILTGGGYRVWGPDGTAWGSNNGVSLATLMVIPLVLGVAPLFAKKLYRGAIYGAASMCLATVLGTQSRGGLVGLLAMSGAMVLRTRRKFLALVVVGFSLIVGFIFMPQSWHERMKTIQTYEQDASASTRIIQWKYAIDISLERPLFGNGFDAFFYQPYYFKYLVGKDSNRAVHSNYFQVLGEQGYIGLTMYLLMLAALIISAKKYAKKCAGRNDLMWAGSLIGMAQFSVIGYAANGLTLNTAYLDLYYYLLVFIVLLISHIRQELGLNVVQPWSASTASNYGSMNSTAIDQPSAGKMQAP